MAISLLPKIKIVYCPKVHDSAQHSGCAVRLQHKAQVFVLCPVVLGVRTRRRQRRGTGDGGGPSGGGRETGDGGRPGDEVEDGAERLQQTAPASDEDDATQTS